MLSTAAVAGERIYYVTPNCQVVCAAAADGTIHWSYDLMKERGVRPFYANICSPLVAGDLVFVTTGNGIDEETSNVAAPKAPSFVALDKRSGKLVWESNLPGENIIEGQWSSPTLATVKGKSQVIFAGGDGVIYSFELQTGMLLWKCGCLSERRKPGERADNYIVGTPVVVGERLYVGMGVHPEHPNGQRSSHFLCLDITRRGDVSLRSFDAAARENKGSALVWAFGGPMEPRPKKGRGARFGSTMSTAAVHDGLVYITEEAGYLHCLDADSGRRYWEQDFRTQIWASPLWVADHLFVPLEDGMVAVVAHGRTANVVRMIDMEDTLRSTPAAANETLYVATGSKLYAIRSAR